MGGRGCEDVWVSEKNGRKGGLPSGGGLSWIVTTDVVVKQGQQRALRGGGSVQRVEDVVGSGQGRPEMKRALAV